jgi:hypothetical protein
MVDQGNIWIQRLSNPDPQVRQEAIRQLEMIGDPALLGPLAHVFATDPDPALRRLAQQAGKTIYYAAIKRASESQSASQEERERVADILAKAQARKQVRRR